jgi:large subunit ribosomal protein L7/L12
MSKIQNLMEEIKGLSVVEVLNLVELLEKEFGVSAASMAAASASANVGDAQAAPEAAKTSFKVELVELPGDKTKNAGVIKALRAVKKDLGLLDAKQATEKLPYLLFENATKEEVENAKKVFDEAGAKIKVS